MNESHEPGPEGQRSKRILDRISLLAFPLFLLAIYALGMSLFGEARDGRQRSLGNGLLWLGFAMGFQSLRGGRKTARLHLTPAFFFLGIALLVLAGIIFSLKPGGLENPVGLGLCSAGLGLLSMGRDSLGASSRD